MEKVSRKRRTHWELGKQTTLPGASAKELAFRFLFQVALWNWQLWLAMWPPLSPVLVNTEVHSVASCRKNYTKIEESNCVFCHADINDPQGGRPPKQTVQRGYCTKAATHGTGRPGKMWFGSKQPDLRFISYCMFMLSVGIRCLRYHLNRDKLLFFFIVQGCCYQQIQLY